jgi:hypothetical protein
MEHLPLQRYLPAARNFDGFCGVVRRDPHGFDSFWHRNIVTQSPQNRNIKSTAFPGLHRRCRTARRSPPTPEQSFATGFVTKRNGFREAKRKFPAVTRRYYSRVCRID